MHPELLSSLVAERHRDLAATAMNTRPAPSARAGRRALHMTLPHFTLPRFRVTWTRTTLTAVADRRRGRSVVIVISATRTL
jgi:hypothetical protein